jgi:hypothetical protein
MLITVGFGRKEGLWDKFIPLKLHFSLSLNCSRSSSVVFVIYRGADKSFARPAMKQAKAKEDFGVHISNLQS